MEDCAGAWSLALEDAFVRRPTHASPRPGSRRGWRAGKATGPESQGSGAARPEAQPRPLPVPGSPHYRGVARRRPEAPRPGVPGRGEGARRRPGGSRPRYIFSLEEGREIGFAVTRGHLAQRTGGVRGDGPQPRSPSYPPQPQPRAGLRHRRGSEGAAWEVRPPWRPPAPGPYHSVPLIMRCAGEPAVPSESLFLWPPPAAASLAAEVSVPPPLIPTSSAHRGRAAPARTGPVLAGSRFVVIKGRRGRVYPR